MTSPNLPYRERKASIDRLQAMLLGMHDAAAADGERDFTAAEAHQYDQLEAELRAVQARGVDLASKADLVDLLRDAGIARAAAERIASGGFEALTAPTQSELAVRIDLLTQTLETTP